MSLYLVSVRSGLLLAFVLSPVAVLVLSVV